VSSDHTLRLCQGMHSPRPMSCMESGGSDDAASGSASSGGESVVNEWAHTSTDHQGKNRMVGSCLDGFLSKCNQKPVVDDEVDSWGAFSGLAFNDVQNLARPSSDQAPRAEGLTLMVMMNDEQPPCLLFVCPEDPPPLPSRPAVGNNARRLPHTSPTDLGGHTDHTTNLEVVPILRMTPVGGAVAAVVIGETRLAAQPLPNALGTGLKVVRRMSRKIVLDVDQAEKCPVCLDCLSKGQHVITLPCNHQLHRRCCTQYFRTSGVKPVCPVCRFDMAAPVRGQGGYQAMQGATQGLAGTARLDSRSN